MVNKLSKMAMVAHFGRGNTNQPLLIAKLRLLFISMASIGLAAILQKPILGANLPTNIPWWWLSAISLVLGFAVIAFTQLLIVGVGFSMQHRGFSGLLQTLPLSLARKWYYSNLPAVFGLVITWVFGGLVLLPTALSLEVNIAVILVAWTVGSAAGFGFLLNYHPRGGGLKTIYLGVILAFCGQMLERAASAESKIAYLYVAICGLIIAIHLLGWRSIWKQKIRPSSPSKGRSARLPWPVPARFWFIVKVFYSDRLRTSISVALCLSITAALAISLRHTGSSLPKSWLLFCAMLASTLTADIRGLSQKKWPPEILLVRGPVNFVFGQIVSALLLSIVVTVPIVLALASQKNFGLPWGVWELVTCFLLVTGSASIIGLLASTLFVAGPNDVGQQTAAALTATVGDLVTAYITSSASSTVYYSLRWLAAGIAAAIIINATEARRIKINVLLN